MRTTVDLPPLVHQRAKALADERGVSLSATIADLTIRGLSQLGEPVSIEIDPRTGFPVVTLGVTITNEGVARILDVE